MRKDHRQKRDSAEESLFAPSPDSGEPQSDKPGSHKLESFGAVPMFRALLDGLEVGVALASPTGDILYANARFSEMLGGSPFASIAGSNLKRFVAASSWADLDVALKNSVRILSEGEMRIDTLPRRSRRIQLSMGPFEESMAGPLVRIVTTENTQLVEATKALKNSEASVHSLASHLLRLQDEERRRMARDLHDITGQELAVAAMSLDQAVKHLGTPGADTGKAIVEAAELVRKVESEIRTLSYVLHPPLLDEMGLPSALRWYVDGFVKRTGIQIEVIAPENAPRFSIDKETALFRVIQEALTNILRHSGSTKASVRVSLDAGLATVVVHDEGKGFDVSKASAPKTGVGIPGMRGRLDLVGGHLDVRSGPRGTEVTATVPISEGESPFPPEVHVAPEPLRVSGSTASTFVPHGDRKRILIADDHEIARRGIRDLFRDLPDLEICGEAQDGLEAVAMAQELNPDLIILDLTMPRLGGFAVAYRLRQLHLDTKLLIYTTHTHAELDRSARAAGCAGYVEKANAARDLIRGIRAVLQGKTFYADRSDPDGFS